MLQLRVQTNAQAAEHLEDLLFSCGAVSVSYEDAADEPILEPSLGDHPLWSNIFLQAHFIHQEQIQLATKALENDPSISNQIILEQINDQGWQESFQQRFSAMQFGRLWIYPSWQDNPAPDGLSLQLDPGLAFGTGHHPTTSLCLQWLSNATLNDLTLTDFGCGSGILALAALRLGAQHVYAVDIDPQALIATRENIACNNLPLEDFTIGKAECLADSHSDIIIANILAAPLLELRSLFLEYLKPKGILVVSGILNTQVESIKTAYADGFQHLETTTEQDWACLCFQRRSP